MSTSRSIPLGIKRKVRQRCGFGCVKCGFPLYEYDHMKEWSVVKEHNENDITLLCDTHHKMVTNGLITRDQISKYNSNPFNHQKGVSGSMPLHYEGKDCSILIGTSFFKKELNENTNFINAIVVDNIPLVGFVHQDGQLLLNINQFDSCNRLIFQVINNELAYSIEPWDIELVGTNLKIRNKPRNFLIEIDFKPPNSIYIKNGLFFCNGIKITIKEGGETIIQNNKGDLRSLAFIYGEGVSNGIIIGENHAIKGSSMIELSNIERF